MERDSLFDLNFQIEFQLVQQAACATHPFATLFLASMASLNLRRNEMR
jgi:hypothetical protein